MPCAVFQLAPFHGSRDSRGMACEVALIGFGEAGEAFARAGAWGTRAIGYDLLADRCTALAANGLVVFGDGEGDLGSAPLVLSLVTAEQALSVAQAYAPRLAPDALWCDGNSVAPETKCAAARVIEAAGGRYVDLAILAPVEPQRLAVPLLLAGEAADEAAERLRRLGFSNVRIIGDTVGRASTIKMLRSVMIKGIEALTDEMMVAAEAAGVTDEVLQSLDAVERLQPWAERAAYNRERMATHGMRRSAEMKEVEKTLLQLGIDPLMTRGTVHRQRLAALQAARTEENAA